MDKVLTSHLTSSSRYQTKYVNKVLTRQLMMSYALRFFLDQPLKQWLPGRKRGKDENTKKLNISRTKRAF